MKSGITRLCEASNGRAFLLALLSFGCAPRMAVIPDVPVNPPLQYEYYQEQDGLSLAIEPFFEGEEVTTYFGINLLAQGILPVLVIAENHHSKSGYLLDKKEFSISKDDNEKSESVVTAKSREPAMPYSAEAIKRSQTAGTLTMIAPLAPVLLVPAILIGGPGNQQITDVTTINNNLRKKAFIDKSIFPGEIHSGFIYFQMKDEMEIKNVSAISLKVRNMLLDRELSFNFRIQK